MCLDPRPFPAVASCSQERLKFPPSPLLFFSFFSFFLLFCNIFIVYKWPRAASKECPAAVHEECGRQRIIQRRRVRLHQSNYADNEYCSLSRHSQWLSKRTLIKVWLLSSLSDHKMARYNCAYEIRMAANETSCQSEGD